MALKIEKSFKSGNSTPLSQDIYDKVSNQVKLIVALSDLLGVDLEDFSISKYEKSYYFNAEQCSKIYKKCQASKED